jgi:YfiH family protein
VIRFAWTNRADGDLAGPLSDASYGALPDAPRPWTWLHQVHGPEVVVVSRPGEHAGVPADAAVTATPGCALAVRTADCAPVVLTSDRAVGVVHAGWKGLAAGVVEAAVRALRALDDTPIDAHLGPCIRPGCYEFAGPELDGLAQQLGGGVRGTTGWGTPSLDLPAAVRAALNAAGVDHLHDDAPCTACDRRWFSHRARAEAGRFATVAWISAP